MTDGEPTFYVIETARKTYWDGKQTGDKAYFTDNLDSAMKFFDEASAEVARCHLVENLGSARCRSTEHDA